MQRLYATCRLISLYHQHLWDGGDQIPDDAPEQSYSERQIFEAASSRLARELAAMEQTDEKAALAKILEVLNKAALIHHKAKEAA